MTERENLPAKLAVQGLAATAEKRGSLVARGMTAFQESKKCELNRKNQDERYRQARAEFERRSWMRNPAELEDSTLLTGFTIFQQLADENFSKAYFPLSCLHHEARLFHIWRTGQQEDIEKFRNHAQNFSQRAFDWCFANRANQDVEIWCDLGEMYQWGEGVETNHEQAVYWFRKAAEQGDARGQLLLGKMYDWGHGVEDNFELAVYWFTKSAEQGNAEGQYELGNIYSSGITSGAFMSIYRGNVEEQANDELAVYWDRKAAEQGHYYAQEALKELEIDWEK